MNDKILIIGAGLSGLSCALTLHQHKIPFHIIEADDDIGGRIRTDRIKGFLLDRGFQVFLNAYPEANKILDYDKLKLKKFYPGSLIRYNQQFYKIADPFKKPLDAILNLNSPIGNIKDKLLIGLLRQKLISRTDESIFLNDEDSTRDFLLKYGFSENIINTFFRPFFGGVFLDDTLSTSSTLFKYIFKMFSLGDSAIPEKGMQEIPKQLFSRLPIDQISFNTKVENINENNVVKLASGTTLNPKAIVIATDAPNFHKLVKDFEIMKSLGVINLYYSAEQSPIKEPILILNGNDEGPINNLCVLSNISKHYAPMGKSLISITVLENQSNNESLEEGVRKQLKSWFGIKVNEW